MEKIFSQELAPALGPYCHGMKCGNLLLTSGAIPEKKDGSFVYEIKEATFLTLRNLLSVVEAAGGSKESIARVCVQAADLACGVPIEAAAAAYIC